MKRLIAVLGLSLGAAACSPEGRPEEPGEALVSISAPLTAIPADGECGHITVTRLSDFAVVVDFHGLLATASFRTGRGQHRVAARAYAQPCAASPAEAPWVAGEQIADFQPGNNTLRLDFKRNVKVDVDPNFEDEAPGSVIHRPGSRVRIGRNGEDAAGPDFALDGWRVTQIALPPSGGGGTLSETLLFSTEGSGIPYTPRGLAIDGGNFVLQVAELYQPLWVFDGAGNLVETLPVFYPAGAPAGNTDGLDSAGPGRFVRTLFLASPIDCAEDGSGCKQSGWEVLERKADGAGGFYLEVVETHYLPELPGLPLNFEYPVGITMSGGETIVATLPGSSESRLVRIDSGGFVAAHSFVPYSLEGLFVATDGRLAAAEYGGLVLMYDTSDFTQRGGEVLHYAIGVNVPLPLSIAWVPGASQWLVLTQFARLAVTNADMTSFVANAPIDLTPYAQARSVEYRADTNEVLISDFAPPFVSGLRTPTIDAYDYATGTRTSQLRLAAPRGGGSLGVLRMRSFTRIASFGGYAANYRLNSEPDKDTWVYVYGSDGSLLTTIDLRAAGFTSVSSVNYLPPTDELLILATDLAGQQRVVATSPFGALRRSYLPAVHNLVDFAYMGDGPYAGDYGLVSSQPSEYLRAYLP